MANDLEQQLYSDMADLTEKVPKLQDEIKLLKQRLTKLSKRIENRESMAFQDQISNLNDKVEAAQLKLQEQITHVSDSLLVTAQFLARFDIEWIRWGLSEWSSKRLSKSTVPTYSKVRQFLLSHSATAKEKTRHSSTPLSVAMEFRKECEDYFEDNKLHPFLD